jgi:uncharacterized protein YwgA
VFGNSDTRMQKLLYISNKEVLVKIATGVLIYGAYS